MDEDDFFTEFANAVSSLRRVFLRHGLEPPVALELGSMEAGSKLQLAIPKDMIAATLDVNMRDRPDPDVVMHFMGVEVRYPAALRSGRKGQFEYDDGVKGRRFFDLSGRRIR